MKKLLTLLLAVFMISAVIFITACEDKHTELPAITISSTSKELPPKTTTKENVGNGGAIYTAGNVNINTKVSEFLKAAR